jgi:pimeloyl-ACP methyl ester carboxylesterase
VVAGSSEQVQCVDGRSLEILDDGPVNLVPLLYHSGTPSGAVPFPRLSDAAARHGLRLVTYSRPGYGASTPRPGRSVADVVDDVEAILDRLGTDQFMTLGSSGGGPHALATAALLADRCRGAALMASVAPFDAAGLDWLDGMGPENVEEFGAALEGHDAISGYLDGWARERPSITAGEVTAALGELVSDVDRAALTDDLAEHFAASMRQGTSAGIDGWRDDDLAFARPWGFALDQIGVPVSIWQGGQDRMVPPEHGRWLGAHVAGARMHFLPGEGHLSLFGRIDAVLDELAHPPG